MRDTLLLVVVVVLIVGSLSAVVLGIVAAFQDAWTEAIFWIVLSMYIDREGNGILRHLKARLED